MKYIRIVPFLLILTIFPFHAFAQDDTEAFDFWLSEEFVKDLAQKNTILFPLSLKMEHRTSTVHTLAKDCEIHVAAKTSDGKKLAWPSAVVVEPPNLCKERGPGMSATASEKSLRETLWPSYFDAHIMNRDCLAIGFPRIFTEHAAGSAHPANPNHVLEIHPALRIECGSFVLDMKKFLKAYRGMRSIQPTSAQECVSTRKLYVRKNQSRYEFLEEGGNNCGNFVVVDSHINSEWVRALSNGGHTAIARVNFGCFDNFPCLGPYTLKLYTYPGTPEDAILTNFLTGTGNDAQNHYFHGMLTYDYFSIIKTLRKEDGAWIDPADWTPVKYPIAMVVFGEIFE